MFSRAKRDWRALWLAIGAGVLVTVLTGAMFAQQTLGTGSIIGTVTDPSGAVLSGAKVNIANAATGQMLELTTNAAGSYSSGPLNPGSYKVTVAAKGFSATTTVVQVQVTTTSTVNAKMQLGAENTVVEVQGSEVNVNTEQATVQGVLTTQQIENLPVNGRNFLDLAQLEPGVQIQEGSTFDPTKNGFSSISFGGRFGRTVRVEVDGVDVSDETVGTTTQNIPASAIQEFSLSQSSLDMSTELTSSGAVNVVTRSGTNTLHGQAFGYFRDQGIGTAALPGGSNSFWQRQQFGGNLGGALIKDKLFWFVDVERNKQLLANPIPLSGAFAGQTAIVGEPFHEIETTDRLDYHISNNARFFWRYSYDKNDDTRPFGAGPALQPFLNKNQTASHALGVDFNTGSFTHSIRFEYLKFHNQITDGSSEVTGAFNPLPNTTINIGQAINQCASGSILCTGPSFLAPQVTLQSDHQIKYDGSKSIGNHILRYGGSFNHIAGGGYASFFALAPSLNNFDLALAPGGSATNPLDYLAETIVLGNGQGFATEKAAFGYPAGGQHDNRGQLYFGDAWKLRSNFTLSLGIRWLIDEGRTDSDLPAIPALNAWGPGLGNRVNLPKKNFAPNLGFAWAPGSNGRTVIRGGVGLYYENAIFNNVLFDRPARLQSGLFLNTPLACLFGSSSPIPWPFVDPGPVGTPIAGGAANVTQAQTANSAALVTANFCNQAVGVVSPQAVALQQVYQAAAVQAGPAFNNGFIGNPGAFAGPNQNGLGLFAPNYKTPRSLQMNIGFQRELSKGLVLTADYIRNVAWGNLLGVDVNHDGDVSTFSSANAAAARDNAQAANGCPAGAGQVTACMLKPVSQGGAGLTPGAALAAYGGAGIGSPVNVTGGAPCPFCAFPGKNPTLGTNVMNFSQGRSVYNGVDISLKKQTGQLVRGIKSGSFQVSYSLSRYVSPVQDSDFVNQAFDYHDVNRFIGPNALDRTHQFSFGGFFDLPLHFRIGAIGHFSSPLPQNTLFQQVNGAAEILVTDVTGDGTTGDFVPGTKAGAFMRDFGVSGLNSRIAKYNATSANQPTPAGAALIGAGVFSLADLQSIGGVMQPLAPTAPGAVGLGWLKTTDFNLGWRYTIKERFTIEPSVGFFNAFNFPNFDLPGNTQGSGLAFASAAATQGCSTIGGTTAVFSCRTNRASLQSGTNALGAPRSLEWGLKFSF